MKLGRPVSPRTTQALLLIARLRFLTQAQLAGYLFLGTDITPGSRRVLTRRILKYLLLAIRAVEASPRLVGGPVGGSSRVVYSITPLGKRLARVFDSTLPAVPGSDGRASVPHSLAVAEALLTFHRSATDHPGHELVGWETEWQIGLRLGPGAIVPDAHLVYATPDHEVEIVLEVDLGTEGSKYFTAKIARYLDLLEAASWHEAFESWPLVLTVTPSDARAVLLVRATERYLKRRTDWPRLSQSAEFAFASLPQLGKVGPLGQAWHVPGREEVSGLLPECPLR